MKKKLKVLILLFFVLIISCRNKEKDIQRLITNGGFKYWLGVSPLNYVPRPGPRTKNLAYFDIRGNWLLFEKSPKGVFERADPGDVELNYHWHLINDSLVYIQRSIYTITKLTKDVFENDAFGDYTKLVAAPDSMIPKEFQKYQK